ncbi:MAG: FAD-binding oxidoreductase [Pontibacterium sp.]
MLYQLKLNGDIKLQLAADEALLDGLARYGYRMRKSCRNGVCEICTANLQKGSIWQRYPEQNYQVNPTESAVEILACTSYLRSDCDMHIKGLKAPGERVVNQRICDVESIELINHDVYRVFLNLPATASLAVNYEAGQYLNLVLADGKQASFSIASAPEAGRRLELHIRHMPQSDSSNAVIDMLKTQPQVTVELPMGDCWLNANQLDVLEPLVFVAASTGFAQMKSMIEHLLAQPNSHQIHLYWGAKNLEDLYDHELALSWADQYENLDYTAVVENAHDSWEGSTGLVTEAILADFDDLSHVKVYASGSPGMVYGVLDALEEKGLNESQMKADVFAYAPRNK